MGKIVKQSELEALIASLKACGKTVVTTNGCFDILHVGHVRYLQRTKEYADVLVLAMNSDVSVKKIKGEGRPINNENDRAEILCALSCVDYVVMFDEESPKLLFEKIKPDVYTKGADYTVETLPEADTIIRNGGRIEFITFVEGKSTTTLIEKINKDKECG